MSPTARSMVALRERGFIVGKVEQTIPHTYIKRDLFGFGDLVGVDGKSILIVQVTSGSNLSARLTKIKDECHEAALTWLRSGGRIELHGWRKAGPRGERKTWQARIVSLTESDVCQGEGSLG